jgi:branched-chain amino acid transport system permease protein
MTTLILEQIINGIVAGSIYALAASGVALTYGTMRILNFAHGEFYMLGAYAAFFLLTDYHANFVVAIIAAALIVFALAALVHVGTLKYLLAREDFTFSTIALTMGLSILLQNSAMLVFGERFKTVDYYVSGIVTLGSIRIPAQRLLILAAAILVMLAMGLILRYTRGGMAVRAVSEDPAAAEVVGIPTKRLHTIVFGSSALLASIAAGILLPLYAVNPWIGAPLTLKAFVVVVLGGLGSVGGAVAGGFLLGIVEALGTLATSSEWQDVFAYAVVVAVIWIRPAGIFGKSGRSF